MADLLVCRVTWQRMWIAVRVHFTPGGKTDIMKAGLTHLTDDDLTALRDRIVSIRALTPEQRQSTSDRLAVIVLEQERRLSLQIEGAQ
jgi:hypothetical protein